MLSITNTNVTVILDSFDPENPQTRTDLYVMPNLNRIIRAYTTTPSSFMRQISREQGHRVIECLSTLYKRKILSDALITRIIQAENLEQINAIFAEEISKAPTEAPTRVTDSSTEITATSTMPPVHTKPTEAPSITPNMVSDESLARQLQEQENNFIRPTPLVTAPLSAAQIEETDESLARRLQQEQEESSVPAPLPAQMTTLLPPGEPPQSEIMEDIQRQRTAHRLPPSVRSNKNQHTFAKAFDTLCGLLFLVGLGVTLLSPPIGIILMIGGGVGSIGSSLYLLIRRYRDRNLEMPEETSPYYPSPTSYTNDNSYHTVSGYNLTTDPELEAAIEASLQ